MMKVKISKLKIKDWLTILLIFTVILRIPTFFEPHWYFDEGIYATIGKWWVNGAKLYTDVWDHKPPGIFLIFGISYLFEKFTSVNILFWAKLAATISVLLTQILLFKITSCIEQLSFCKKNQTSYITLISPFLFGLLTSLPFWEGHMANGEIFMVLFTTLGIYLILKFFWNQTPKLPITPSFRQTASYQLPIFLSGLFFAIAILIKPAAIFDCLFCLFFILRSRSSQTKNSFLAFTLGTCLPILLIAAVFFQQGNFTEFYNANITYNLTYITAGAREFVYSNLIQLGKLVLFIFGILLIFKTSRLNYLFLFSTLLLFDFVSILLSSRLYIHYLIQGFPAFSILGFIILLNFKNSLKKTLPPSLLFTLYSLLLIFIPLNERFHFNNWIPYQFNSFGYYQNFTQYILKCKTQTDYNKFFGHGINENQEIVKFITAENEVCNSRSNCPTPLSIFIWGGGETPWLYYDSNLKPATRFTNYFHIENKPDAYKEVIKKIKVTSPQIIVLFDNTPFFPELEKLLNERYFCSADLTGNAKLHILTKH